MGKIVARVVVEVWEDGFVGRVVDVGDDLVVSQGDSLEELIENLKDAVATYYDLPDTDGIDIVIEKIERKNIRDPEESL